MTPDELIAFEVDIAAEFNAGKIKAPVHLYSGGEEQLISIFENVHEDDWVLCSWRSHYQCLLKGVPPELLKQRIMEGKSISLCFPEYRILSSAIVGGVLPIAVGLGLAIRRSCGEEHVHCFLGDMTRETGIAHESIKYAENFDLPVTFYVEDNGISVCTNTHTAWGIVNDSRIGPPEHKSFRFFYNPGRYPHAGSGKRVEF